MYIWTKTVTYFWVNLGFIKVALIPEGRYQLSDPTLETIPSNSLLL
jgi:hypothetical protein